MTRVAGRTAFITGGANGIGLGIARAFARAGARLALVDVDAKALDEARAELSGLTDVMTEILDVRDRDAFAGVADRVEARLGPVSLLVNNAGVAAGAPADRLTYELWDWALGINLDGVIHGVQTFLGRMLARGEGGHIVNTASGAGLVGSGGGVLYHTAKFAVVGMSEALEAELKPKGIGISVLCPGPVATSIVERTAAMQPAVTTMSEGELAAARARRETAAQWLARGVPPDRVGDMVLRGVEANQLFILSDRFMEPFIKAKTEALLAAMPPAEP